MADRPEIVELCQSLVGKWIEPLDSEHVRGRPLVRFARLPEGDDVVVVAMSREEAESLLDHGIGHGITKLRAALAQPEGSDET